MYKPYKCESDLPLDQQMRNIKRKQERQKLIESGKTDKRLNIPTIKKRIEQKTTTRLKESVFDVIFLYTIGFNTQQVMKLTEKSYSTVTSIKSRLSRREYDERMKKYLPKTKPTKSVISALDLIFSGHNVYKVQLSTNRTERALIDILNKIKKGYYFWYIQGIKDKKICDEVKKHLIKKFL